MTTSDYEKLEKRARNVLLFQLSRSMKTKSQLRQILIRREIPAEIVEPLLDRFEEAQLIDDHAFATSYVAGRMTSASRSIGQIRRELRTKGCSEEVCDLALAGLSADQDLETARRLVMKRHSSMAGLERDVVFRRLSGMLMRRGFSGSVTQRVISEILGRR